MNISEGDFSVYVDVMNPGQFFGCCGLLELAHRLWPGAEGWFDASATVFSVSGGEGVVGELDHLLDRLAQCPVMGPSEADRMERKALERERRELKKHSRELPPEKESRRKQLGVEARQGKILLGEPFNLVLDWWEASGDDGAISPKTWAGHQELHKVTRAAQDALGAIVDAKELFNRGDVLRKPEEYCGRERERRDAVEPFYFDARRFAPKLDVGFSLDVQDAETIAYPAVELLCLIGLQRFRPAPAGVKWSFDYWTWSHPIGAAPAAAVVCGATPGQHRYRFRLLFRDDQKRYKAFSYATHIGGSA